MKMKTVSKSAVGTKSGVYTLSLVNIDLPVKKYFIYNIYLNIIFERVQISKV